MICNKLKIVPWNNLPKMRKTQSKLLSNNLKESHHSCLPWTQGSWPLTLTNKIIVIVPRKIICLNKRVIGMEQKWKEKGLNSQAVSLPLLLPRKASSIVAKRQQKRNKLNKLKNTITPWSSFINLWRNFRVVWIMFELNSTHQKSFLREPILLESPTKPSPPLTVTRKSQKDWMRRYGRIKFQWLSKAILYPTTPNRLSDSKLMMEPIS